MKMSYDELQARWSARADASVDGPPAGYRFCHLTGHFARLGTECTCKVPCETGEPAV